jgi:hypothetical protein
VRAEADDSQLAVVGLLGGSVTGQGKAQPEAQRGKKNAVHDANSMSEVKKIAETQLHSVM